MGLSYGEAAKALDTCKARIGYYSVGNFRQKKTDELKKVDVPKIVLLCLRCVGSQTPTD